MSSLSVYHESFPAQPNKVLTHVEDIASTLAAAGIQFERRETLVALKPGASEDEVLAACGAQLDAWMTEFTCTHAEVISLDRRDPEKAARRDALLDEQRRDSEAVHCTLAGSLLVALHIEDYVYAIRCERHDLVRVPAGVAHWVDIGEEPHVLAISLFKDAASVAGASTGSAIAAQYPGLDD